MCRGSLLGCSIVALMTVACSDSPTTPTRNVDPGPAPGVPARIELSATPGIGAAGGTAVVVARVQDGRSEAVANASVVFSTDAGSLTAAATTTNGDGIAQVGLTAPAGLAHVTATAGANIAAGVSVVVQPVTQTPSPSPSPTPPDPTDGGPLSVTLTASGGTPQNAVSFFASVRNGTAPIQYAWGFGDGATLDGFSPTTAHLYSTVGTYAMSITVRDGAGRSTSASADVLIAPAAVPTPAYAVSVSAAKTTLLIGETTTLTATVTALFGATPPTSYLWDCTGDGIVDATTATNSTTCTYPTEGVVTSIVSVTNGTTSGRGSATLTIGTPPPASFEVTLAANPTTIEPGQKTTLTATATPKNGATAPTSYAWDCNNDGTIEQTTSANTFDCTIATSGTVTAKVTAKNGTTTGSATKAITVLPVNVTVTCTGTLSSNCNVTPRINQVGVAQEVTSVEWTWNDGSQNTTTNTPFTGHTFPRAGDFEVDAKVTLGGQHPGASGTGTVKVTVQ